MIPDKCKTCGNLKYNKCTVMLEMYENCPAWTDNPERTEEADIMTRHYSGWLIIQRYLRRFKTKRTPSKRGEKKNGL